MQVWPSSDSFGVGVALGEASGEDVLPSERDGLLLGEPELDGDSLALAEGALLAEDELDEPELEAAGLTSLGLGEPALVPSALGDSDAPLVLAGELVGDVSTAGTADDDPRPASAAMPQMISAITNASTANTPSRRSQ